MMADKVEIDMLTKYSKIFNFDDSKVKIKKLNNKIIIKNLELNRTKRKTFY